MLHFEINPHSGVPVYRQLMDQVKYYLAGGTIVAGDQLPSIRELAEALTVNPTTIVKAYSELEHEGFVEMRQGKGAFIAPASRRRNLVDKERVLRRLARQLAVETAQMGMDVAGVLQLVEEELRAVRPDKALVPVKISMLGR